MARLLLIDDDPDVLVTLSTILSRGGHSVVTASDGREGLDRFAGGSFALVICDILMPGMEGIETIQRLRALDPAVRIIAITGSQPMRIGNDRAGDLDFLRFARELGASAALRKPFDGQQLLSAVARALEP